MSSGMAIAIDQHENVLYIRCHTCNDPVGLISINPTTKRLLPICHEHGLEISYERGTGLLKAACLECKSLYREFEVAP